MTDRIGRNPVWDVTRQGHARGWFWCAWRNRTVATSGQPDAWGVEPTEPAAMEAAFRWYEGAHGQAKRVHTAAKQVLRAQRAAHTNHDTGAAPPKPARARRPPAFEPVGPGECVYHYPPQFGPHPPAPCYHPVQRKSTRRVFFVSTCGASTGVADSLDREAYAAGCGRVRFGGQFYRAHFPHHGSLRGAEARLRCSAWPRIELSAHALPRPLVGACRLPDGSGWLWVAWLKGADMLERAVPHGWGVGTSALAAQFAMHGWIGDHHPDRDTAIAHSTLCDDLARWWLSRLARAEWQRAAAAARAHDDAVNGRAGGTHARTAATTDPPHDALERLGLAWPTSRDAVVRAWREAARRTHPDATGGDAAAFVALRAAYERCLQAVSA